MSESSPVTPKKPLLSDTAYNWIKRIATILLPALTTLYFALDQVWDFPDGEKVMGSIAAVNVFFGGLIQVSKKSYYARTVSSDGTPYAGDLVLVPHPEDASVKTFVAHLDQPPAEIAKMQDVTFKVQPEGK